MFITLHCGGMPFDGNTIKEKSLGGSETAAYYVARGLAKLGHRVSIFTNCQKEMIADGVKYIPAGELSEQYQLGVNFHYYATSTPIDVLIIQRHPAAFAHKYQSKINIWWLHDLALKRSEGLVSSQVDNINYVAVVSEYHKKQVCDVYAMPEDRVIVVRNGVDLDVFSKCFDECTNDDLKETVEKYSDKKILTYSSRPERGFEHLVKPGGIMEQLGDDYILLYCSYDNTVSHMSDWYRVLEGMASKLPNVENVGNLTKTDLAYLMQSAYLHVYPTEFEEVSCITAMECTAAGLPFLSSKFAALPETCGLKAGHGSDCETGSILLSHKDGQVDCNRFAATIRMISRNPDKLSNLVTRQHDSRSSFTWDIVCENFETMFKGETYSDLSKVIHMYRTSDIVALDHALGYGKIKSTTANDVAANIINAFYTKLLDEKYAEHYNAYYEYEKNRGVNYGPENMDGNTRYEHTKLLVETKVPANGIVLDYGCAHGHYTVNLAKAFPDIRFVGVDTGDLNIKAAKQWAEDENLTNVEFHVGDFTKRSMLSTWADNFGYKFDLIIAEEVLEHVIKPEALINSFLESICHKTTDFIISTPFGEWEAIGYREHNLRAHVIHFEKADIHNCFGHFDNFDIVCIPSGHDRAGNSLGSYVTTFTATGDSRVNNIDYDEKWERCVPYRQTCSLAMIVYNAEDTISKMIKSCIEYVDEFVIAVDKRTNDNTIKIIDEFENDIKYIDKTFNVFKQESPLDIGFAHARNKAVLKASCDWVFWMDADETLVRAENFARKLRPSLVNGYAVPLNHISLDPPEVLKVDYPVKLFRNGIDVSFYGLVHEHPEVDMNEGIPFVKMAHDFSLGHTAYADEGIRRARFSRNLPLLLRDREENPDRYLGKFLYIRDLAQMNGYELERNQGGVTQEMLMRCYEGIRLFEELLNDKQYRMIVDGFQFYNELTKLTGYEFEMAVVLDVHKQETRINEVRPIVGKFHSRDFALRLLNDIANERTAAMSNKYI